MLQSRLRQISPGSLYHRSELLLLEIAVVHTPEQTIAEERRTRGLRTGSLTRIHHRTGPVALRLLQFGHRPSHTCELLYEERLTDIGLRHILQHLSQSGEHPSVATRPEILLTGFGLMLRIDIPAVAVVQARLCIQHDAVAVEDILVELTEILGVTRQTIHLRHHRHHHIEGIGPPPVIVHLRVGLIAHHLLGACHSLLFPLSSLL